MKKCNSPISAQLVIPASFAECLTYEKQILWLKKEIDSLSGGGDPEVITELQRRVSTLENRYTELQNQINDLPIDVIENELNTISADIQLIKNSLDTKQDVLTFDDEPTAGSSNPVRSEGILEAIHNEGMRVEQLINGKVDEETFNEAINNIINNYVTKGNLTEVLEAYAKLSDIADMATKTELVNYAKKTDIEGLVTNEELTAAIEDLATKSELANKQDKLTFDNTPTEGSSNPVTSGGIYEALQNVTPTGAIDDTVTAESSNPVKSSGIYSFVKAEEENLATKDDIANFITEDALTDYATKTELADYATKTDISDMATKTELVDYATKTELADYAKTEDLDVYATKVELGDYVRDGELATELSNYATKTELSEKQNTLTFDNTPTADSMNPVTSDGIKKAIDAVVTTPITVDSTVSQSSENPVTSNGIYNFVLDQMGDLVTTEQLATKQDKLTFDQSPTSGSSNPVTSGGIYSYVENKVSDMETKTNASDTYATKAQLEAYATTESVNHAVDGKQDKLTFDQSPTPNSANPVTSGGVYAALQASGGDWYDAYYTEDNKIYIDNEYTSGRDISIAQPILCKDISDDIKLLKFTFILYAANSFAVGASIILKSRFFSFTGDAYPVYIDEKGNVYGLDTLNVMLYDSSLVNDSYSVKGNYQFMKYTSGNHPSCNTVRILNNSPSTAIGAIITWICVGTKLTIPPA